MIWAYRGQHYQGLPCIVAATSITCERIAMHFDRYGHPCRLGIVPVRSRRHA